jgi:hypothetical protein
MLLEKLGNNVKVFCFCNRDVQPKVGYREVGSKWCANGGDGRFRGLYWLYPSMR